MRLITSLTFFLFILTVIGCAKIANKVENRLEQVGTELTGTAVNVEEADVKAVRGAGEIKGFQVDNPEGYEADYLFSCERIHVNVGLVSTIAGEPLVLDRMVISYPILNFEQNQQGGSNLEEIVENVKKNREKADLKSADLDQETGPANKEPLRLKIRELLIEGVTLNVLRADGSIVSAILPAISLTDIGGDTGVTPAQLGLVIAGAMSGEVLQEAIARQLIQRAGDIKQALSADNLMAALDYKLNLSLEIKEQLRPLAEDLSKGLTNTIDVWVGQSYINIDELNRQLAPVLDKFKQGLSEILDSEQFEKLEQRLAKIQGNAIEVLRYLAIEQIGERLNMTPEHMMQLRPVLHEYFVRISEVVKEIAADPKRNKEMFLTAYNETAELLRTRLSETLSKEQMDTVNIWLAEAGEKILIVADRFL